MGVFLGVGSNSQTTSIKISDSIHTIQYRTREHLPCRIVLVTRDFLNDKILQETLPPLSPFLALQAGCSSFEATLQPMTTFIYPSFLIRYLPRPSASLEGFRETENSRSYSSLNSVPSCKPRREGRHGPRTKKLQHSRSAHYLRPRGDHDDHYQVCSYTDISGRMLKSPYCLEEIVC